MIITEINKIPYDYLQEIANFFGNFRLFYEQDGIKVIQFTGKLEDHFIQDFFDFIHETPEENNNYLFIHTYTEFRI